MKNANDQQRERETVTVRVQRKTHLLCSNSKQILSSYLAFVPFFSNELLLIRKKSNQHLVLSLENTQYYFPDRVIDEIYFIERLKLDPNISPDLSSTTFNIFEKDCRDIDFVWGNIDKKNSSIDQTWKQQRKHVLESSILSEAVIFSKKKSDFFETSFRPSFLFCVDVWIFLFLIDCIATVSSFRVDS